MKRMMLSLLAGWLTLPIGAAEKPVREWNFENATPNALPAGWVAAKTGTGPGSDWKVLTDNTSPHGAKTVAQMSGEGPNPLFNLCVAEGTSFADVDMTVAFKPIKGEIDQGGGLLWRYQDANNYYVARFNPLEDNYRVYKVTGGKRKQLATADATGLAGQWHTMRVVHKGDQIQCYLNGKLLLQAKDTEIPKAGKIGFWTKADAVTAFDGLVVREAK
ncbi:MAG: family 16 glycoside hydrolase [Verrucomicrobiota bacterium]